MYNILWIKGNGMEIKEKIVLRRASMQDAELLFQWKNDKATIENSITKRGVTMEEHLKWLQNVIDSAQRQLFILDVDGVSVGQLRLDMEVLAGMDKTGAEKEVTATEIQKNKGPVTAEISYGLGAEFRGKGLGKVLLKQAETLAEMFAISELTAEVLPHNIASQKLFKGLGFAEEKKEDIYVYKKQYG